MKISIITTTYNRRELLKETIKSVSKSILVPYDDVEWEHVIYDDGSTDGTEEMCKNLKQSNLIYIKGVENKGPSYAKNRAIEKATGEYILVLDSDDVLLQRSIYNFTRAIKMYPETKWFETDFLRVDNNLTYIAGEDYYGWEYKNCQEMLQAIFRGEHFIQGNAIFNKDLFFKVGSFDESMRTGAEDLDLFIRFLLLNEMPCYINFISHLHRHHRDNLSNGITPQRHFDMVKNLREEKYKEVNIDLKQSTI